MSAPMLDKAAKLKLQDEIATQAKAVAKATNRLISLRVEWEMHQLKETEPSPDWLKPEYRKIRTITDAVMNGLEHKRYDGIKLEDFEEFLSSVALPFHKPTISATLGRLKRSGRVIRTQGGYWKLNSYANRSEEEKKT